MHRALDWITPLHGIAQAPDVIAATAITAAAVVVIVTHIIPEEAVPTVDTIEAAQGGDLIPATHHDHNCPDDTIADHDLIKGIDLTTEASLDPQKGVIATDPILQIISIPDTPRGLLTRSGIEQVEASIPSHEPVTDQVAKIVCGCKNCL